MSYHRPVAAEAGWRGWNTNYSGGSSPPTSPRESSRSLADDVSAWRAMRVKEYGLQLGLVERMQNEITALQALVATQESRLSHLKAAGASAAKAEPQRRAGSGSGSASPALLALLRPGYEPSPSGIVWGCVGSRS